MPSIRSGNRYFAGEPRQRPSDIDAWPVKDCSRLATRRLRHAFECMVTALFGARRRDHDCIQFSPRLRARCNVWHVA
jgi:hypothetical protein